MFTRVCVRVHACGPHTLLSQRSSKCPSKYLDLSMRPSAWNPYRKNCWQCTLPTTREQPKPTFSWAKNPVQQVIFKGARFCGSSLPLFHLLSFFEQSASPVLSQDNVLCVYSYVVGTGKTLIYPEKPLSKTFLLEISMLLLHQANLCES